VRQATSSKCALGPPPDPRVIGGHRRAVAGSLTAGVVSQLVLVVSGVLAARLLGPEDRGYLALVVLVPLILAQIGHMGVPLAATYYIVLSETHVRAIVRSLARITGLQTVLSLLVQAVILLIFLRDEPESVRVAGLISFAYTPSLFAQQFALSVLQGQRRFRAFNILRVLPATLYSVSVLAAFLLGLGDLITLFTLLVATSLVACALTSTVTARGVLAVKRAASDSPQRSEMVWFGLKGFFGSVSPIDNLRVDQAVIALLLNPVALGLYVVAQSFTNLPRFIAQSIGMVAYPQVAAASNRRAARRAMWRYFLFSSAICGLVIAVLEGTTEWLIRFFFGSEFLGGVTITRILLVGVFFLSARRVLADGARGAGSPAAGSVAEAVSWASLAVGLVILVPRFDLEGVAIALAASWALSLLVLLALVADVAVNNLRERFLRASVIITIIAALAGAAFVVALLPLVVSVGLTVGLIAVLVFAHVRIKLARALATITSETPSALRPTSFALEESEAIDHRVPDLRLARWLYYAGLALIGVLTLRPVGSVTLSDWFFFFSLATVCASLAVTGARVYIRLPSLLMAGALIFVIGSTLSTFDSDSILGSNAVLIRMIYITVIWFWLGTMVLQKLEHLRLAIVVWVVSAAFCGSGAIIQLLGGDVIPGAEIHWGRLTGFTQNVNDLGGVTSAAFVPALMVLVSLAKTPLRMLGAGVLLSLVAAGLLLSGSVGSIIAASVAAAVWFGAHRTRVSRLVALAAITVAAITIYTTQISEQTPSSIERITHLGSGSPDDPNLTLDDRIQTYRAAINRVEQNPIVGVGLNRDTTAASEWVHNIFLGTWYTTGLLGLVGMTLIFVASGRAAWWSMLSARSVEERGLALALSGSFIAFLVFVMSEPALFIRYGWVSVALVCTLRAIQTTPLHAGQRHSAATARRLGAEPVAT
jgi:O-antigen/teichoic acid export membrane protein/O-antigen ligase